jgi:hypothetical protein
MLRSGSAGLDFYQAGNLRIRLPGLQVCPFKVADPRITSAFPQHRHYGADPARCADGFSL